MKFTFRSTDHRVGRNYEIEYPVEGADGRFNAGNFAGALNKVHRATGGFNARELRQPADSTIHGTDADVIVVFNGLEHVPPLTDAVVFQSIVDIAIRAEQGEDIIVQDGRIED